MNLDGDFYTGFDENFIYSKAITLYRICEEPEKSGLQKNENDDFEGVSEKKYIEALAAEIYFSELLQFEAMFALLLAIYQNLPHWLYLTTYKTADIKEAASKFISGDFLSITNGVVATSEEFFTHSLYSGYGDTDHKDSWSKSIENISFLTGRMAEKYIEAKEFNAYKHGLRMHTGETLLTIKDNKKPDHPGFSWSSKNSIVFLETEKQSNGEIQVYRAIRHFNPEESINHILIMKQMLASIKNTRMARIQKKDRAELLDFSKLDMEEFKKLKVARKWRMNF